MILFNKEYSDLEKRSFFDIETIEQIIVSHYFPHLILLKSEPLHGGLFNTTRLLFLSDGGKIVLRISPETNNIFSYEKNLMLAEKEVNLLCRNNSVSVPEVFVVEGDKSIINRPFMITSFIEAKSLHRIRIPTSEKDICLYEAGRMVKKMHGIVGEKFGRVAYLVNHSGFDTWSEALEYEIMEWKKVSLPVDLLPSNYVQRIDSLFDEYKEVIDKITVPHLTHGDLWEGNILASLHNGQCCFEALIDYDHAMYGDPEFDFPSKMLSDSFAEGYGRKLEKYEENQDAFIRRKLYLLLFSMKQCYVFKYLHQDEENSNRQKKYIERILEEFCD